MATKSHRSGAELMDKIGKAHLSWKRFLQRGLKPYGVNLKQIYLLRRLSEEEFLFPADIADELFCDRPTATVIIRNLERKGWLTRVGDPHDGKRVRVTLTAAGADKLASVPKSAYRSGCTGVDPVDCFDEEEIAAMESLMERLVAHLGRY